MDTNDKNYSTNVTFTVDTSVTCSPEVEKATQEIQWLGTWPATERIRRVIADALAAHDQQRAAELRERVEAAAKEIERQQKAKHSDLTFTGDRYFRGALSADEMRDIIEAALAATAK